jgi:hypothetical protein
MAQREFPLKNIESVMKIINSTSAIDNARSLKEVEVICQKPCRSIVKQAKDIIQ